MLLRVVSARRWCYCGYLWSVSGVTEGSCGQAEVLLKVVAVRRWCYCGSGVRVNEGSCGHAMVLLKVVGVRR